MKSNQSKSVRPLWYALTVGIPLVFLAIYIGESLSFGRFYRPLIHVVYCLTWVAAAVVVDILIIRDGARATGVDD